MISPAAAERFAHLLETTAGGMIDEPLLDTGGLCAALAADLRAGGTNAIALLHAGGAPRRRSGVTLPTHLAALKRCREACRHLLRSGGFAAPDRDSLDDALIRAFDALELESCTHGAGPDGMEAFVGRIRHLHMLGAMARPLGHEINNLLQPVIGMAFSVRRKFPADSAEARNLTLVFDAGKQASAVVNDLLGLARQRGGAPRPVDPMAEVQRAVALLRFRPQPGVALHTFLASETAGVILPPGGLTEIVLELAINGLEAMAQTGGALTITLKAGDGTTILEVQDTGPGMTPEVLTRCREPFFTTKPADPGAGLGLTVVQGLADAAGGGLEIDSAAGGTTLRVILPAATGGEP